MSQGDGELGNSVEIDNDSSVINEKEKSFIIVWNVDIK